MVCGVECSLLGSSTYRESCGGGDWVDRVYCDTVLWATVRVAGRVDIVSVDRSFNPSVDC